MNDESEIYFQIESHLQRIAINLKEDYIINEFLPNLSNKFEKSSESKIVKESVKILYGDERNEEISYKRLIFVKEFIDNIIKNCVKYKNEIYLYSTINQYKFSKILESHKNPNNQEDKLVRFIPVGQVFFEQNEKNLNYEEMKMVLYNVLMLKNPDFCNEKLLNKFLKYYLILMCNKSLEKPLSSDINDLTQSYEIYLRITDR